MSSFSPLGCTAAVTANTDPPSFDIRADSEVVTPTREQYMALLQLQDRLDRARLKMSEGSTAGGTPSPYHLSDEDIALLRALRKPIDAMLAENGNNWDRAGLDDLYKMVFPLAPSLDASQAAPFDRWRYQILYGMLMQASTELQAEFQATGVYRTVSLSAADIDILRRNALPIDDLLNANGNVWGFRELNGLLPQPSQGGLLGLGGTTPLIELPPSPAPRLGRLYV